MPMQLEVMVNEHVEQEQRHEHDDPEPVPAVLLQVPPTHMSTPQQSMLDVQDAPADRQELVDELQVPLRHIKSPQHSLLSEQLAPEDLQVPESSGSRVSGRASGPDAASPVEASLTGSPPAPRSRV